MKSVATQSGFTGSVAAVRQETLAFKGEVVMVAGDTHYMWVDKALTDVFPGLQACRRAVEGAKRILNFTRAEVSGSNDIHWMMCHIRLNIRNESSSSS